MDGCDGAERPERVAHLKEVAHRFTGEDWNQEKVGETCGVKWHTHICFVYLLSYSAIHICATNSLYLTCCERAQRYQLFSTLNGIVFKLIFHIWTNICWCWVGSCLVWNNAGVSWWFPYDWRDKSLWEPLYECWSWVQR